MTKFQALASPFGEVTLGVEPNLLRIRAREPMAADWALGWWHGREAGDEAVLARAFWQGRLGSEGRPSAARTEVDAFIGSWNFTADLEQETAQLPAGDRARVQAYSQGFNQGRRRRSQERPWTPEDCHLLVRTLGFLEWWEIRAPQAAFLVRARALGLSWDKLSDLWPGLGTEPDRPGEAELPEPLSPEAWELVRRIRRFRPGTVWALPGARTADGQAVLAASFVTDVTDPGLPFLAVLSETPAGTVRGLSRPGHPGFLAGRTDRLAWHAQPAADDTVDLKVLDGDSHRQTAGFWAGAGRTGTLGALLGLEGAGSVPAARRLTAGLGSASLDLTAADAQGEAAAWALGVRWVRPEPRDAWVPGLWGAPGTAGPRSPAGGTGSLPPGRPTPEALAEALVRTRSDLPEDLLPSLRFLLPDSDEGQRLRRWTGVPETGPEAAGFERLAAAVFESFWEGSPLKPAPGSAVFQALLPQMVRLVQAPHSAWFPSAQKNRRLAEAVRRAFVPGQAPGLPVLGRKAPKPCWTEETGGRPRIWAATVALAAGFGAPTWKTFVTDDETEVPVFRTW